ncbi:MAG: hypothetical protein WCW47_03225 [Candidatus Paceibacterota bacterium]|jgi:hypothetical protein
MKTRFLLVALVVLAVLVSFTAPASAQINNVPGAPYPGMIIPTKPSPVSVAPMGITGTIYIYNNGQPVTDVSITVSQVKTSNGPWIVDEATSKKFEPCVDGDTSNCTTIDEATGLVTYFVSKSHLPGPENEYSTERLIDVRAEAKGAYHHINNQSRMWFDGRKTVEMPSITMYSNNTIVYKPKVVQEDEETFTVGTWIRQEWDADVIADYIFDGASTMKAKVNLGQWSTRPQRVGRMWRFIGQRFYKFRSDTAYVGGQFCVGMQIRPNTNDYTKSAYDYVSEQTKPVCLAYAPPIVYYYNNNR